MTTIAFKNGVLAADTALTSGVDAFAGEMTKIAMCDDFMGGASGNILDISKFLDWVEEGADFKNLPEFEGSINSLLISKKHEVRTVGKGGISRPIEAPFHAIGSGEEAAKGALIVGATAKEAVEAAIHIDLYSGGHADVLSFK